jgi:alpha-beta hydrolase superfamily lysophospholipase
MDSKGTDFPLEAIAPAGRAATARLAVALVALLIGAGCAGPQLRAWHTESLEQEFTARKAAEVRDFDGYRALEKRLSAELESTVYDATPTGADHALVRFSRGSMADPMTRQPNWNWSFELPADRPRGGVLLLHGMSDSPYTFRALGEALNREGYHVVGLRLPGHGTAPSGLRDVHAADMRAAVKLAAVHLSKRVGGQPLHLVGYSTGGTLALDFALDAMEERASPVPASIVLISPAVGLHPAAGLAGVKRRIGGVPGLGGLSWLTVEAEFDPYKYNSFATNGGEQVHRLTRSVGARIARLERSGGLAGFPPTLVFKSEADATVSTRAVVTQLLARLPSEGHELVLFDVNRAAAKSILLAQDPRSLSGRVMGTSDLPFAVTLVTNRSEESLELVARHQPPRSAAVDRTEPLGLSWPPGVISLSHVALPFPPDDPLYGRRPPDNEDLLFLGQMGIQGERGLLLFSSDFLLRLRHNPFYDYIQSTTLAWLARTGATTPGTATPEAADHR